MKPLVFTKGCITDILSVQTHLACVAKPQYVRSRQGALAASAVSCNAAAEFSSRRPQWGLPFYGFGIEFFY